MQVATEFVFAPAFSTMSFSVIKFDKHFICGGMPSLLSPSYYPHLALHPGICQPVFVILTLLGRDRLGSCCGTNISLFVYWVITASSALKQMCLILRTFICLLHYPACECQILSFLLLLLILHARVSDRALNTVDKCKYKPCLVVRVKEEIFWVNRILLGLPVFWNPCISVMYMVLILNYPLCWVIFGLKSLGW